MGRRFSITKIITIITTGLLLIVLFAYILIDERYSPIGKEIPIIATWELPEVLEEISGIAYMGNNRMACIQDEDGFIFIYDLEKKQIVKEIEFAGGGDYESIALSGNTAYVLKSDGTIYEVNDFISDNPNTRILYKFKTSGKNFEGLEYDIKNNRLLLSIKEGSDGNSRPVFSFDLETEKLNYDPFFKIAFSDPVFSKLVKKPSNKLFRPSEISIHPKSGKIYMLEGTEPKILILNENGTPEKIHFLSRRQFRQAEGLGFGDNGEIYISNEGNGAPPNILQISLN